MFLHFCIPQENSKTYAAINVNPVGGGGSAGKGWRLDAWDYPHVGLLIVPSDPGVSAFDFDRKKPGIPGINSEAVTKSVPRGFWKSRCWRKVWSFHLF